MSNLVTMNRDTPKTPPSSPLEALTKEETTTIEIGEEEETALSMAITLGCSQDSQDFSDFN